MKTYLIVLFIFISSFITAQTIITSKVGNVNNIKEVVYRTDTFYIKNNIIVWNSIDGSVVYYINNYSKLSDNKYIINCITNGKVCTFVVDFNERYVIINGNIIFYQILKL